VNDKQRDPRLDAIRGQSDIVKLTTSLAGAALVFSINLTTADAVTYSRPLQWGLVITWILLGVSVFLGLWTLFYTPQLLASNTMTIDAPEVRFSFLFSLLALGAGIAVLAFILVNSIISGAAAAPTKVNSAMQAIKIAVSTLPASDKIAKVETIEMIKGNDENRFVFDTWHVRLDIRRRSYCSSSRAFLSTVGSRDIFIDPESGQTLVLGTREVGWLKRPRCSFGKRTDDARVNRTKK
jgi:hypothetical protein